jgi:hypothetical protein
MEASSTPSGAGSTLASPAAAAQRENPPNVVLVNPPVPLSLQGTMPSKYRGGGPERTARGRGISPLVVFGLVVLALVAGFLCGWAVGRAT